MQSAREYFKNRALKGKLIVMLYVALTLTLVLALILALAFSLSSILKWRSALEGAELELRKAILRKARLISSSLGDAERILCEKNVQKALDLLDKHSFSGKDAESYDKNIEVCLDSYNTIAKRYNKRIRGFFIRCIARALGVCEAKEVKRRG